MDGEKERVNAKAVRLGRGGRSGFSSRVESVNKVSHGILDFIFKPILRLKSSWNVEKRGSYLQIVRIPKWRIAQFTCRWLGGSLLVCVHFADLNHVFQHFWMI